MCLQRILHSGIRVKNILRSIFYVVLSTHSVVLPICHVGLSTCCVTLCTCSLVLPICHVVLSNCCVVQSTCSVTLPICHFICLPVVASCLIVVSSCLLVLSTYRFVMLSRLAVVSSCLRTSLVLSPCQFVTSFVYLLCCFV